MQVTRRIQHSPGGRRDREFLLISVTPSGIAADLGLAVGHTEITGEEGSKEVRSRENQGPRNTPGRREVASNPCISFQSVIENPSPRRQE